MNAVSHIFSASVDLLNILLRYAGHLGFDEHTVLSGCGLDSSNLYDEEERIPIQDFHAVWQRVSEMSRDSDFGLHFGEFAHGLLSRHLLYAMMMNCETVGQAVRKKFQYHNMMMDIIRPFVRVEGASAYLSWDAAHPAVEPERHFVEAVLALFVSMLRLLTEDHFHIQVVRFIHSRPSETIEHERIFRSSLAFNQRCNEVVVDRSCLDLPILFANRSVLVELELLVQKTLHRQYARNSWTERVADALFAAVLHEKPAGVDAIATQLAVTTRSLQMRLKQEGATFRKLNEGVRKEIAIRYLEKENAAICEIALLLGFSDQSAFQHAFRRWTGVSPGAYRKGSEEKVKNI